MSKNTQEEEPANQQATRVVCAGDNDANEAQTNETHEETIKVDDHATQQTLDLLVQQDTPKDDDKMQVYFLKDAQRDNNNNNNEQTNLSQRQRSTSVVSFKERCEFYDLEQADKRDHYVPKPAALTSVRYYIMLLALVGPFCVTYSKTIINFAITDMIHPDILEQQTKSGTNKQQINSSNVIGFIEKQHFYFEDDNSCPITNEGERNMLIDDLEQDRTRARTTHGEKFKWGTIEQGQLKSAYSMGHILFQIAGGRLSEMYGSHLIMSVGALLIGLACLCAPYLAAIHFYLLYFDLLLLGVMGSFITPALITLFSNWLAPSEKSVMITFYLISSRLGFALSSFLCGSFISAHLSWRYLFYTSTCVSGIFSILFSFIARSKPSEHPFITNQELEYLASKNTLVLESVKAKQATSNKQLEVFKMVNIQDKQKHQTETTKTTSTKTTKTNKASAPWMAILSSKAVWAFVITKFSVKIAGDTIQIELPTYLKRVMHVRGKTNGNINTWNYVIFCAGCFIVGSLARYANKKHPFNWSKTTVRKLFQCTASFGVGIAFIFISMTVCQTTLNVIFIMLLFALTTFSVGGEAQIPLDMSERYAGTIHAIGSSLSISGVIEPILVGFILKGHGADKDRWRYVWLGASACAFFGGLTFLIFGDATIQPFDKITLDKKQDEDAVEQNGGHVDQSFEHDTKIVNNSTSDAEQAKPNGDAQQGPENSYKESRQI